MRAGLAVRWVLAAALAAAVTAAALADDQSPPATAAPPSASAEAAPQPFANGNPPSSVPLKALGAVVAFLLVNIAALLGVSLCARFLRGLREARKERFRRKWEPVLYGRLSGDDTPLPPLERRERIAFLSLWLHVLGYVRDEAADALAKAATELDMPRHVLELLHSRSAWKRLLAIRAAAALRLKEATDALLRIAARRDRRSAFDAAGALVRIDPDKGFELLGQLLAPVRWSPEAIAVTVRSGGRYGTRMLAELLATQPKGRAKQVARLAELLDDQESVPALRERLLGNRDPEEIAAILHALGKLGGAQDRAAAIALLAHRSWLVRMQAAVALGALGTPRDAARIVPLLHDPQWWVRYRTAQAVLRLGGARALRQALADETDPQARESIERVLAER